MSRESELAAESFESEKRRLDARGNDLNESKVRLIGEDERLHLVRSDLEERFLGIAAESVGTALSWLEDLRTEFEAISRGTEGMATVLERHEGIRLDLREKRAVFDRQQLTRIRQGKRSDEMPSDYSLADLNLKRDALIGDAAKGFFDVWNTRIEDEKKWLRELNRHVRASLEDTAHHLIWDWRESYRTYVSDRYEWHRDFMFRDLDVRKLDISYGEWRHRMEMWEPTA